MASVTHFLAMGGYAAFVWPAYGVSLLVIGLLAWWAVASVRRTEAALVQEEVGEPGPGLRPRVIVRRAPAPPSGAAAGPTEGRP